MLIIDARVSFDFSLRITTATAVRLIFVRLCVRRFSNSRSNRPESIVSSYILPDYIILYSTSSPPPSQCSPTGNIYSRFSSFPPFGFCTLSRKLHGILSRTKIIGYQQRPHKISVAADYRFRVATVGLCICTCIYINA